MKKPDHDVHLEMMSCAARATRLATVDGDEQGQFAAKRRVPPLLGTQSTAGPVHYIRMDFKSGKRFRQPALSRCLACDKWTGQSGFAAGGESRITESMDSTVLCSLRSPEIQVAANKLPTLTFK